MTTIYEGECCEDCLLVAANDDCGDETARERIKTAWRARWPHGYVVPTCAEDCEGWFSWRACQACGDTDGGNRHPFAVLAANQPATGTR